MKFRAGSFEAEKVAFSELTVRVADPARVVPTANAIRPSGRGRKS